MFDLFRKNKPAATKNLEFKTVQSGSFMEQVLFGGRVTATRAHELYRTSSVVATAIDTIAKEMESITPVVKLKDGTLSNHHPVLDLLKNPNEFDDYREFIGGLARYYLLNHDAFIYCEGVAKTAPATIFASSNLNINIMPNMRDGYPETFIVNSGMGQGTFKRTKNGRKVNFYDGNLKELYQIHGFSSRVDNCTADSPLEAAALETRQQVLGKKHNIKLLDNGGRLSMAVIFKDEMTSEQWKTRKEAIYEQFAGAENSGKIAVFASPDMEIEEMGMNNKDMDFGGLDKASRECIFARYGVPLPIVSADSQTYNNFSRAIEDLYDRAVIPYTKIIHSGLTQCLRGRFKDSFEEITFNPEDIPALRGRMLQELKERRDINIETVNELRQGLPNREPLEGGNTYYQPATLVPAGEDLYQEKEEVKPDEIID